jgi:hypothetical protein
MSIASLTLKYAPEDEFHGELSATVKDQHRVGFGSAWFNLSDLRDFAETLRAYPLDEERPHRITGGEGLAADGTFPLRKTLDLHLTSASRRVMITIHLETGLDETFRQITDVEFRTTYGTLESFRRALVRVLNNSDSEAILIED